MKNILLILIFSIVIFSCEKHNAKIEIYLLKRNVLSSEGMPLLEYLKLKKLKKNNEIVSENERNWSYDSVKQQFISGGKFFVSVDDLQDNPLVSDEDILKLDLEKSELFLSKNGKDKISRLKSARNQFAICVDKQPILTGYFRNNYSSVIYSWNYIGYYYKHSNYNNVNNILDSTFVIRQNPDYEKWKPILADLTKYPKLINAFKKTERLK